MRQGSPWSDDHLAIHPYGFAVSCVLVPTQIAASARYRMWRDETNSKFVSWSQASILFLCHDERLKLHQPIDASWIMLKTGPMTDIAFLHYAKHLRSFDLFARLYPDGHEYHATLHGPTYPFDQLLRTSGAIWQQATQSWAFKSDESLKSFVDSIAQYEQQSGVSLAEESRTYIDDSNLHKPLGRLLKLGPNALSNQDLLELFLSLDPFLENPSEISAQLFDEFGSLGAILKNEPLRLARFEELTPRLRGVMQAIQLTIERVLHEPIQENPVIGSSQALLDYLRSRLQHRQREELLVLYLDKGNRLIKIESVEGTIDHLPLYPRDIAARSLELFACGVILAHNHPAGDQRPSRQDLETTKQVRNVLEALRMELYDHVIVCRRSHFSFKEEGLL